ncbi:MAG: TIGR00296 family protein, partial [Desulfobacterales bacterium]|nr:TIGR00296 family protein [Desulfobacterales bacterium]
KFSEKSGVFVTLSRFPSKELRGCIGYVMPVMKLKKAICDNALNAALEDPRFPALRKEELDRIVVEISLLTVPEKIKYSSPEELLNRIQIGKDGLIMEKSFFKGLLLPQVPVEWGWDVEEFLSHTCMKAGLSSNTWRKGEVTIKKFSAAVFSEKSPRGKVIEKELL